MHGGMRALRLVLAGVLLGSVRLLEPGSLIAPLQLSPQSVLGQAAFVSGAAFHTLPPCRLLDTRDPEGPFGAPALQPDTPREFDVSGVCGLPADASALVVNVTITNAGASGTINLYPA